jgi:hypothetical protein
MLLLFDSHDDDPLELETFRGAQSDTVIQILWEEYCTFCYCEFVIDNARNEQRNVR